MQTLVHLERTGLLILERVGVGLFPGSVSLGFCVSRFPGFLVCVFLGFLCVVFGFLAFVNSIS